MAPLATQDRRQTRPPWDTSLSPLCSSASGSSSLGTGHAVPSGGGHRLGMADDRHVGEPGIVLAVPPSGWPHDGSLPGAKGALRQVTGLAGTAVKGDYTMFAASSWGYRHPRACTVMRLAAGSWNLVLGILLLSHGYRWGSVLLAVSALIFGAAYTRARAKSPSRSNGRA